MTDLQVTQHRAARIKIALAAISGLSLTLMGCSDPKAASKANFRTALQGWFDAHPECVNIGQMPATVRADGSPADRRGYEALTAAGLLSVQKRRENRPPVMGQDMSYDALVYQPTDAGAKVIRKSDNTLLGGSDLCFARRVVGEVTSFTEPADVMGVRVSQVRYTYRLEDMAPWARDTAVRAALPSLAKAAGTEQGEDKAALVLTSEGWQHERSLSR